MTKAIEFKLSELLLKKKKTLSVAESCTGGFVSNLITNVPGSSAYFMGGIVVYSNQAKSDILRISQKIIQEEGAVSRSCAIALAQNIRNIFHANIGLGITGIAGPHGGSIEKPVGTVYIAVTDGSKTVCELFKLDGNRSEIKQKASINAIQMLVDLVKNS